MQRIDRRDPQAGALPQHGGERSASEGYDFAVGLFREQLQFVGCPVNGRTARTRVRYEGVNGEAVGSYLLKRWGRIYPLNISRHFNREDIAE